MTKARNKVGLRAAWAAVVTATLVVLLMPVGQASATARAGCTVQSGRVSVLDTHAAFVQSLGGCDWIGVRHRYDPVWSMNDYYTDWSSGSGMLGGTTYYSSHAPVYLWHEATW